MKYKGKELDVFKSDENVAFNPSHPMIVWNDSCAPVEALVLAYLPSVPYPVATVTGNRFKHCAEVPKSKTNWEAYREHQGCSLPLDCAKDLFRMDLPRCIFCPAAELCIKQAHNGIECSKVFSEWAEREAKDET